MSLLPSLQPKINKLKTEYEFTAKKPLEPSNFELKQSKLIISTKNASIKQ